MKYDILKVIFDIWCKISGMIPLSNANSTLIIPKLKKINKISERNTAKNIPTYKPISTMYEAFDKRYKLGSLPFESISKNKTAVKTGALLAAIIVNHLKIFS